ncbi:hypothetical protein BDZ45DRAFT_682431 [Acephala macrosclerotiorum]|nr:hypothetical protein BDZ45DRAFT_682431 [Acephala macrosclerotiorum]
MIEEFFKLYATAIEQHRILLENTYNWDEKGFLISLCRSMKRIMIKELYNSGKCKKAAQDKSREFISLLATICGDGSSLSSALIYKGPIDSLQDTWAQDLKKEEVFMAASSNG